MLYISSQNYQQKQTDYQNKQSFYAAETALDCLKALLVKDVEQAYLKAYQSTTKNYARLSAGEREDFYKKAYVEALEEMWKDRAGSDSDYTKAVREFMTKENGVDSDMAERIYNVEGFGKSKEGQFVLQGVKAKYTSGIYTTFLYTDICIEIPSYGSTFPSSVTTSSTTSSSETSGSETSGSETSGSTTSSTESKDIVALTDYVVYMNWSRADYYDTKSSSTETSGTSSSESSSTTESSSATESSSTTESSSATESSATPEGDSGSSSDSEKTD
jgi:hypothetical protein